MAFSLASGHDPSATKKRNLNKGECTWIVISEWMFDHPAVACPVVAEADIDHDLMGTIDDCPPSPFDEWRVLWRDDRFRKIHTQELRTPSNPEAQAPGVYTRPLTRKEKRFRSGTHIGFFIKPDFRDFQQMTLT